jgi:hypothetical protein
LKSGTVYGTTRAGVNLLLYEEALKHSDNIKIHFNHKLNKIDFTYKELVFDIINGKNEEKKQIVINA